MKENKMHQSWHENLYKEAGGKSGKRVHPTKLRGATLGVLEDTMWKVLHTNMKKLPKDSKIFIYESQEYYKSHFPPRTRGKNHYQGYFVTKEELRLINRDGAKILLEDLPFAGITISTDHNFLSIAQNAYCSWDINLQCSQNHRSVKLVAKRNSSG